MEQHSTSPCVMSPGACQVPNLQVLTCLIFLRKAKLYLPRHKIQAGSHAAPRSTQPSHAEKTQSPICASSCPEFGSSPLPSGFISRTLYTRLLQLHTQGNTHRALPSKPLTRLSPIMRYQVPKFPLPPNSLRSNSDTIFSKKSAPGCLLPPH